MNHDRWQTVERIFSDALACAAPERVAFVRRAAGHDDALYRDVLSLLEHDADAVDAETALAAQPPVVAQPWIRPGDQFGRYEAIAPLQVNGMADVWHGRRADGSFDRAVVIKMLRGADDALRARFEQERAILAGLQHPNIAALLDAGTERDIPYLVTDFIPGEPITAWADQRALSLRDRIACFVLVCRAVEHAHRLLVVHRDLKPANILVTEDGTPVLLDFGISKVLGHPVDGTAWPAMTQVGDRALTPGWSSPEQVRGDVVTTQTDVFGLGLVLYELLCGHQPYAAELMNGTPLESVMQQTIVPPSERLGDDAILMECDHDGVPRRLSARLIAAQRDSDPRQLVRDVRSLDALVLHCLHPDVAQRITSVTELRQNLEGYLRGDVKRSRVAAFFRTPQRTAAIIGTAALLGFAGIGTWATLEVQRARSAVNAAVNITADAMSDADLDSMVAGLDAMTTLVDVDTVNSDSLGLLHVRRARSHLATADPDGATEAWTAALDCLQGAHTSPVIVSLRRRLDGAWSGGSILRRMNLCAAATTAFETLVDAPELHFRAAADAAITLFDLDDHDIAAEIARLALDSEFDGFAIVVGCQVLVAAGRSDGLDALLDRLCETDDPNMVDSARLNRIIHRLPELDDETVLTEARSLDHSRVWRFADLVDRAELLGRHDLAIRLRGEGDDA